jgi:putative FmdB family regulatory protein
LSYNNVAVTILTEPPDMPIFEYVCQQCRHQFEAIVLGTQKAACPKCESKQLSQQLSSFAVRGEKSQKSDAPASPTGACGSCGDPRGPGACSMN